MRALHCVLLSPLVMCREPRAAVLRGAPTIALVAGSASAPKQLPELAAPTSSTPTPMLETATELGFYMHLGNIAALAGDVYFIGYGPSNGAILRVSSNGGEVVQMFIPMEDPDAIVPTSFGVFYHDVDTHGVFRVVRPEVRPTFFGEADDGSVGGNADALYWSHEKKLFRARSGGTAVAIASVGQVSNLVADARDVYFIGDGAIARVALQTGNGKSRVPVAPGAEHIATPLAPVSAGAACLRLDESSLYWVGGGVVQSMPRDGGASSELFAENDVSDIAVDADFVYVALAGAEDKRKPGAIVRVPKAGGMAELMAQEQWSPGTLAVDENNLYFTASRGERDGLGQRWVKKLPKAPGRKPHKQ